LKEQALEKFKLEHYDDAITLLEQAVIHSPDDPEIYYYLGWFNHYRAYDSRLLRNFDEAYVEQIFKYLKKALELNPNFGDAKYFYGAECCANADWAMQRYDAKKVKYYYERAFKIGAYPDWLLEFGRNFLASCSENAILFTAGDADLGVSRYLQFCENVRPDITVIPIANIDRPWYVKFYKNGLEETVRKINIELTDEQIMEIRPFKWRETNMYIDISPAYRLKYNLPNDYKMVWNVEPDLQSGRIHSKMGEEPIRRTLLSPQRAMVLQIVEDNFSERPIYFSNFAEPSFYGGLEEYFQNCGLVSRLTPIKTNDTNFKIDENKIEQLLKAENLTFYKNVKANDIPRISGIVVYGYPMALMNLAESYRLEGKERELKQLIEFYKNHVKLNINERYEEWVLYHLEK